MPRPQAVEQLKEHGLCSTAIPGGCSPDDVQQVFDRLLRLPRRSQPLRELQAGLVVRGVRLESLQKGLQLPRGCSTDKGQSRSKRG